MKQDNETHHIQGALINIIAALSFFCGSSLFLPIFANFSTYGVILFMVGSLLMLWNGMRDWYKYKKSA